MWGLFVLLLLCGIGLPLPEDILLIAAGLVVAESGRSWIFASVLMYVGVIGGDSLIFAVGSRFGRRLLKLSWMRRWLPAEKQERIGALFQRYGSTAFFLARFMPGLRAALFGTAGVMKVRYVRFLVFDGLAALISVPAFVWLGSFLGHKFGDDLGHLAGAISRAHSYTLIFAVGLTLTAIAVLWLNRRKLVPVSRD